MENFKTEEVPAASAALSRNVRRQGKKSKQHNLEKFRGRKNQEVENTRLRDIEKRLGLFDLDESKQLEKVTNTIQLTQQRTAVPMSVTTRAVGISSAIFYDRATITWNLQAIADIATIYQIYRVHLWMAHYKVFLAQQIQTEPVVAGALVRVHIPDETREILSTVLEVPSLMAIVLDSIGKIESGDKVYHLGYAVPPAVEAQLLEYYTLCVNPTNIRAILENVSNAQFPLAARQEYFRYNCIPGALVENNLLMNADEIYPADYGAVNLQQDVHAYKNLLTRIQPRLPKHAILSLAWDGKASRSGLWSSSRSETRIDSMFNVAIRGAPTYVRNAQGINERREPAAQARQYSGANIHGERTSYWSMEPTPHSMIVAGIASMIGEECFIHSRYELVGHSAVTNTATSILYALSDAPR